MTDLAAIWEAVLPSPFGEMRVGYYFSVDGVVYCNPFEAGRPKDVLVTLDKHNTCFEDSLRELLFLHRPMPEEWVPEHATFPGLWHAVWEIPFGETCTYGAICQRLGLPESYTRAVANAIGCNPLCLLIPCHRVIRKDGSLGGYRWGVETKKKILEYELKRAQ